MFRRKKSEPQEATKMTKETEKIHTVNEKPLICLFDIDKSIVAALTESSYNCAEGTVGTCVRVPNNSRHDEHFLKLNCSYPANLHEYDILVFDMENEKEIDYSKQQFELNNVTGKSAYALLSAYPEKKFDPRPYSIQILSQTINDLLKKESVVIIFADSKNTVEYQQVEITGHGATVKGTACYSNTMYYDEFPYCTNKTGKQFKLPEKVTKLNSLLDKHINTSSYDLVFSHPTHWNGNKQEKDSAFVPLLLNKDDEIVSFFHGIGKGGVFVFPKIKNKLEFIEELFINYLPEIYPNIFPFNALFGWLDNGDYMLPNENQLRLRKSEIESKYQVDIQQINEAIEENKNNFNFLRDLISETGDNLVKAALHIFIWLEFDSVVDVDQTNPQIKEEDIQIESNKGLLVVEVKGIGGTSTDKDCSQISKIKYRRSEERGKFDVFGLYLVNHQRYLPPISRQNPPFSENQINDAVLDKRGLLTTYDLFRAYLLVEQGILTKKDVREQLYENGLVKFMPKNIVSIGVPGELLKDGSVVIVNIDNISIKKGDSLIAQKNGSFAKFKIESIRVNDTEVDTVSTGEIGLKVDGKIQKKSELFICMA